jgi:hypothetical protein
MVRRETEDRMWIGSRWGVAFTAVSILAGGGGCSGGTKPEPTDSAETGTEPITTDTDGTSETGTTPPPLREGLSQTYLGYEELQLLPLVGPYKYGAPVCTISYTLTESVYRDDCPSVSGYIPCEWAFELTVSDAMVVVDSDGVCLDQLGYDASTIDMLNGTALTRAYHADYQGHAQVLMQEIEGAWQAVSYARVDETTGNITWDWEYGLVTY